MPTVPAIIQQKLLRDFQNALWKAALPPKEPLPCWSSVNLRESKERDFDLPCPVWAVEVVKAKYNVEFIS